MKVHPTEFLFEEIPLEYREAIPGSAEFHREYDAAIKAARDGACRACGQTSECKPGCGWFKQ